jgi:hypothetical protein
MWLYCEGIASVYLFVVIIYWIWLIAVNMLIISLFRTMAQSLVGGADGFSLSFQLFQSLSQKSAAPQSIG